LIQGCWVTLGQADRQGDLLDDVTRFCDQALPESSIYAVLHRDRDRLFPDEMFADLFSDKGRRSVPPSVVATVMVLQRLAGLSDRDAVERYTFDARWRYAAGVGGYDGAGWDRFAHAVLVDMRARLAKSADPRRIFAVTLQAASAAGLVGAKRVLDSTPLYDAVATMDTITLIRSAVRGLLRVADDVLEAELRAVLCSGDGYADAAKPCIDWDDPAAREALIDSRARDGYACLALLDGRRLSGQVTQASELLATVLGQDLQITDDGTFRIARRVAKDRVISTVDPQARHRHKTAARGFDGYKGHVAIDPDSEVITDTVVTAGNAGDASVAADLIDDLVGAGDAGAAEQRDAGGGVAQTAQLTVYGDNAYGTGEFGVVMYLASNPAIQMAALSDRYAAATTDAQRATALAAGEAMLALWQGTAFHAAYILGSAAGILLGVVMLRSGVFGRPTGWLAVAANAIGLGLYVPRVGVLVAVFSVVFLEVWYLLLARRLYRLGRGAAAVEPAHTRGVSHGRRSLP
jgi:Transposase domain (DUF772)/Transposase DDE domain